MSQAALNCIKSYGSHCLSISTLQPACEHFYYKSGYIAYKPGFLFSSRALVLGNPICATEDLQPLIQSFLEKHPKAAFVQISESVTSYLEVLGYKINLLGEEHSLDVQTSPISWGSHKSLRRESNTAQRRGITIRKISFTELKAHKYLDVSDDWLGTRRSKRSQQFLTRPLPLTEEPDALYLGAYIEGSLVGFSILSPMYANTAITGYYADISRYKRGHSDSIYALLYSAVSQLKTDNRSYLSLGLSCYDTHPQNHRYSHPFMQIFLQTAFRYGNWLYAFKGIHQFKLRLHGHRAPVFIATKSRFPLVDLLHVLCATFITRKCTFLP